MDLEQVPFSLGGVLEEAARTIAPKAEEKKLLCGSAWSPALRNG